MKLALPFAVAAMLATVPARAQHLTKGSIATVLDQANDFENPKVSHVPAGLPLTGALFAGRPWWAIMSICAEHRAGSGLGPGSKRPVLSGPLEESHKFFLSRATALFASEQDMRPADAQVPVAQWGYEFSAVGL